MAGYPSCHPLNSIEALKKTQTSDSNQEKLPTGLKPFPYSQVDSRGNGRWSLPVCQLSDAWTYRHWPSSQNREKQV